MVSVFLTYPDWYMLESLHYFPPLITWGISAWESALSHWKITQITFCGTGDWTASQLCFGKHCDCLRQVQIGMWRFTKHTGHSQESSAEALSVVCIKCNNKKNTTRKQSSEEITKSSNRYHCKKIKIKSLWKFREPKTAPESFFFPSINKFS